ncbi:Appr-1-p processing protein [Bacillus thuringiensis]|uniref:Appr-1-p processing protein n=2 Tax=Bacillus TaxID=1386 RepID=A0A9X7ASR8_BACTU|nr:Appr-1-p processing protein [Bacillus thuringiensis]PFY22924.1 Appr-1-p processing protein [Bacillus toyonensis]
MIEIVEGNLLDATEDAIVQQVNCQGVMGSGLAKQIRAKHPEVYKMYQAHCDGKNPQALLGDIQAIYLRDENSKPQDEYEFVVNIFGQLNYGRENVLYTNYDALRKGLVTLRDDASELGVSIAIPYNLGCGLANGDWDNVVYPMIQEIFKDYGVTIYKYKG